MVKYFTRMYSLINVTILIATAISCATAAPSKVPTNCSAIIAFAEVNVRKLIFLDDPNFKVWRTEQSFDQDFCSKSVKRISAVTKIKRCLPPFQRTLMNISLRDLKKLVRIGMCYSSSTRQSAVAKLACYEDKDIAQVYRLFDELATLINFAASQNVQDVIMTTFCGYQLLMKRISDSAVQMCREIGRKQPPSDFIADVARVVLGESTAMVCGGQFTSLETCTNAFPKRIEVMRQLMINAPKATNGLLTSTIKLLDAMDQ